MEADKILYYTDGHQVTITDSGFKVRNTLYELSGITRHRFSIIAPPRFPSTLLMILGSVLFVCGALNFIPAIWKTNVDVLGLRLLANSVFMISGVLFLAAGVLIMIKMREKYAVRIFTAEGEKNVVVSQSREYISQIIDALNRAFMDMVKQPRKNR
ncbi:MAG TPA: DUF6232 family protein [Cyclobacteriaceae bacterium]|nr:DUF6232 family protein [Cyclobacteriaceae bacterium]